MSLVKRIWRVLRKPQVIWKELVLRLQVLCFGIRYHFLKQCFSNTDPSRKVLIVSLTDNPAYAKWEGMLLIALRQKKCTPVVLTEKKYRNAQRTFRMFGVTEFIYLEDLLDATEGEVDLQSLEELLAGEVNFKSLLDFAYRNIDSGRSALSTLVRKMRDTSLAFEDPAMRSMLLDTFTLSMRIVHAAEKLFAEEKFEAILFHEKGYTPFGEFFHASVNAGVNTVQYHYGQKPKSFVLKRYNKNNKTIHPSSLSEKSWSHVQGLSWGQNDEEMFMNELRESYESGTWFNRKALLVDKSLRSPEEVRKELGIDPHKKVAIIFSHVLWDASFFFGESLFDDYEHWLIETVKAACENDSVQWLIKLHPDYVWKMKDLGDGVHPRDIVALESGVGELPDHIQVIPPETSITTYSFFPVIDYCITVRGTVGLEAPCFSIPVFTAGTGRYAKLGITTDSSSKEEYLERMRTIQEYPKMSSEQTSLARLHAWAVFDKRLMLFDAFELTRRLKGYGLQTHVDIPLRSVREVESAADLKDFADWVIDSRDEDYLTI
jgi:hypothetical protein